MQISDEMIRDAVEVFMAGVSPEPWDTESATALVRQVLEAALSAEEREIPYHCDVCTVPGHGDAPCSPLCDRSAPSVAVKEGQMINNMLLSQVLQNAFFAGRGTSGAVSREDMAAWQDYDPYHLESFKRIRSALSAQVQDVAGSEGAKAIAAERRRQIEQEGWTPERDDQYVNGELLQAAACYALHDGGVKDIPPPAWPWSDKWWKPAGALRDFEKAGALIAAEIDRRLRAAAPAKQEG